MSDERLTDKQFDAKVELYKTFDERNDGATTYLKTFLEEQDRIEHKLNDPNYVEPKKELWVRQLEKATKDDDPNSIIDQRILDAEFGTGEFAPKPFSFSDFIKGIITSPFHLIYGFFEWYIDGMTLLRGITLAFFGLTTIFCGWIAFLKFADLFCFTMSIYTPFYMISPFESANYFPWILLSVVWILPFLIHFFGKYLFVWIPVVIIGLVFFELLIGDPFLTDAFIALIDGLASKL